MGEGGGGEHGGAHTVGGVPPVGVLGRRDVPLVSGEAYHPSTRVTTAYHPGPDVGILRLYVAQRIRDIDVVVFRRSQYVFGLATVVGEPVVATENFE